MDGMHKHEPGLDGAVLAIVRYLLKGKALIAGVALSLAVHLWGLNGVSLPGPGKSPDEPRVIELVDLSKEIKPPEIIEVKLPNEKLKGQVIDLGPDDPNDKTPPPADAKYLSERNMRTKRETVKRSKARTGSPGRKTIGKSKRDTTKKKPSKKKSSASSPKKDQRDHGAKKPHKKSKTFSKPIEIAKRDPGGPSKEDFAITMADLDQSIDADDGSIDYLPHVFKGEFTSLNARRFSYASFYNRIKKIIRFYWAPQRTLEQTKWNGNTLETRLRMVIEADGSLSHLEVVASCGFPIIDSLAIKAIRKATPFYNVPQGLLDEHGQLDEVWAFYITAD